MPPGRRNPTLAEIAKVAGVSTMTASRALNGQPGVSAQKRDEMLRIAEDLGYVPNRAAGRVAGGRTGIIGVIAQLHSLFTSELVLGIGSASRATGHEMLVYSLADTDRRPPKAIVELLMQNVDGLIVILPFQSDYLAQLGDSGLPIVTIDEGGDLPYPKISADNYQGSRQAIQHLYDLGHRRIGFIMGNQMLASARDRAQAFHDMRAQLGLDADADLIVDGNFMQLDGFDAATRLMELPVPPTAIFAANDISAVGALAAIRDAGKQVPEDVSLVGFDDIVVASQVYPALTTVRQPMAQMARSAVNTLIALISGLEAPAQVIMLPTELVVRQSSAPPPDATR